MILFLSLLLGLAHADDAIFDKPAGKPIYFERITPDCGRDKYRRADKDDRECFGENGDHDESFGRITINTGAGPAWGTEGGTNGALTANVQAFYKWWSDHRQYDGIWPSFGVNGQAGARVGMQGSEGIPFYQMKVEAAGGARMLLLPIGGLYVAVEADSFNRFSRNLAQAGYTQAVTFRIGETGYVLLRYVLGIGRGAISAGPGASSALAGAINEFKGPKDDGGPFPFGSFENAGDLSEVSHSGKLILQLAKFAFKVDVVYGNGTTRRAETDLPSTVGEFMPTEVKRFDMFASAVMPLALLFPNDSLQIEGRYVSLSFENDKTLPGQKEQTSDGSLGIYYGLSW